MEENVMDNQIQEQDATNQQIEGSEQTLETPNSDEQVLTAQEAYELEVQYNKERKKLTKEQAIEYAQKGLNYDKIKEKLENLERDPRLSFVERQAQKNGMTTEQYLLAVEKEQERQEIENLALQKGLPEEVAQEIYESRKFREQFKQEKQTREQQQKQQKMLQDFVKEYPNIKPEEIPKNVWEDFSKGSDLISAYARYENKLLREKINKLSNANETNTTNANASTGSVTGNGNIKPVTFTREQVEKMSTSEARKNYNSIIESMKNWK